jgi:polyketide biosynthesis acyl carrier protein
MSALVQSIRDVIPELAREDLGLESSLVELGANSVDRSEIIVRTLIELKVRRPMSAFRQARCLGDIVAVLIAS